jgi:hypothetical protein
MHTDVPQELPMKTNAFHTITELHLIDYKIELLVKLLNKKLKLGHDIRVYQLQLAELRHDQRAQFTSEMDFLEHTGCI